MSNNYIPNGMQTTFSQAAWFANTPATVPAPPIGNLPAPCWFSGSVRISWTNDRAQMPAPIQDAYDAGKINYFAVWSSPIYDLKPMLQGYTANGATGRNDDTRRAVAVWAGGGSGMGAKLFVQVDIHDQNGDFVNTTNFDGVIVETFERAHVSDPGKVNRIASVQDVTSNFTLDGNKSIILAYMPFGEGMPVRYWQQVIWFSKYQTAGIPEPFSIQGAFY